MKAAAAADSVGVKCPVERPANITTTISGRPHRPSRDVNRSHQVLSSGALMDIFAAAHRLQEDDAHHWEEQGEQAPMARPGTTAASNWRPLARTRRRHRPEDDAGRNELADQAAGEDRPDDDEPVVADLEYLGIPAFPSV